MTSGSKPGNADTMTLTASALDDTAVTSAPKRDSAVRVSSRESGSSSINSTRIAPARVASSFAPVAPDPCHGHVRQPRRDEGSVYYGPKPYYWQVGLTDSMVVTFRPCVPPSPISEARTDMR